MLLWVRLDSANGELKPIIMRRRGLEPVICCYWFRSSLLFSFFFFLLCFGLWQVDIIVNRSMCVKSYCTALIRDWNLLFWCSYWFCSFNFLFFFLVMFCLLSMGFYSEQICVCEILLYCANKGLEPVILKLLLVL